MSDIREIDRKLQTIYGTAKRELRKKLKDFNDKYRTKDAEKRKLLAEGKISKQDYANWRSGQVYQRKLWESKVDDVAKIMHTHNEQAALIVNEGRLDIFAESYNYNAFLAEQTLGIYFGIYNTQAVARLIKDDPQILPEWKIDEEKDYKWNYKKVNNIVNQGIIQGKSIPDITKSLCEDLCAQSKNRMELFARTAITGAQNAGRQKQMEDAAEMGIEVHKQWLSTLDSRTRDSHVAMDGEEVPYNEDFSNGLEYPGDPAGDPAEVYNCRCTMVTIYPKYEDRSKHDVRRAYGEYEDDEGEKHRFSYLTTDSTAFKKWIEEKKEDERNNTIVQGKDISLTWKRRKNDFQFDIEDIINAQGFDGLPQIVSRKEFDKAVKESRFIAQRTYSSNSEEILKSYRNQLYYGKWYVDCSTGGAQYGKGMYCAADYKGLLSDGIKKEMKHYKELNKTRGNHLAYTETFTLDKSAKIITYNDAWKLAKDFKDHFISAHMIKEMESLSENEKIIWARETRTQISGVDPLDTIKKAKKIEKEIGEESYRAIMEKAYKKMDEITNKYNENYKNLDVGSVAALYGYDAINAEGHGQSGSYTVILNRTKCVFLGGVK